MVPSQLGGVLRSALKVVEAPDMTGAVSNAITRENSCWAHDTGIGEGGGTTLLATCDPYWRRGREPRTYNPPTSASAAPPLAPRYKTTGWAIYLWSLPRRDEGQDVGVAGVAVFAWLKYSTA